MSTYLLGAGFNVDARGELGPIIGESIYIGKYEIDTGYPLISHLWPICFGVDGPAGASFEQRLAESLEAGDYGPTKAMLDAIKKADYYIGSRHAKSGPGESRYKEFLRANPGATFLTFNYDSLLEIILLSLERWSPRTGFGVPVVASAEDDEAPPEPREEVATNVLHLHGSICVYTSTTFTRRGVEPGYDEICQRDIPEYRFDPLSTSNCFPGWRRTLPEDADEEEIEKRIIAPVPDKSRLLTGHYTTCIFSAAKEAIALDPDLIAIGYGFSESDSISYAPLLESVCREKGQLTVVTPNADRVASRIRTEFPGLAVTAIPTGFNGWFTQSLG